MSVCVQPADRVLLINGLQGTIHCWTGGGFMVSLETPLTVDNLPMPVKAFDCTGVHRGTLHPLTLPNAY
jgi:hypothetical protein